MPDELAGSAIKSLIRLLIALATEDWDSPA